MNRYVVVSGLPAAGKSTVANSIARCSSLPLFDKDELLESLFIDKKPRDANERRDLSRRADELLELAVRGSPQAIVVSWWKHPRSTATTGTPTDWLQNLPGQLVEIYCECSPETAADRFFRRQRHTGHLDARWSYAELLFELSAFALLGPLNVGDLVTVDTSQPLDVDAVWHQVDILSHGLDNRMRRTRDG